MDCTANRTCRVEGTLSRELDRASHYCLMRAVDARETGDMVLAAFWMIEYTIIRRERRNTQLSL